MNLYKISGSFKLLENLAVFIEVICYVIRTNVQEALKTVYNKIESLFSQYVFKREDIS